MKFVNRETANREKCGFCAGGFDSAKKEKKNNLTNIEIYYIIGCFATGQEQGSVAAWKKSVALFSALACAALLIGGCSRANGQTGERVTIRPVIVVGSDNYPPFNYEERTPSPTGIDVDLRDRGLRAAGVSGGVLVIDWGG